MTEYTIETITLSSIIFKDYDRIVTLFSKEIGLVKLIVKGASRKKSTLIPFCEPLTHAQILFKEKKGDLHLFMEGKILNSHLSLRRDYDILLGATKLLKVIQKSHVFYQSSTNIFLLLSSYLKKLETFDSPNSLIASFHLKMLLNEGCLTLKNRCSKCQNQASKLYFSNKDYFCSQCCSNYEIELNQGELNSLLHLTKIKSFLELEKIELKPILLKKTLFIFSQLQSS